MHSSYEKRMKINKGYKEKALCFVKGFAMGLADLVPGISGGTVAMLTGIYDRWLFAVGSLHFRHLLWVLGLLLNAFNSKKRKHYLQSLEEIDFLFLSVLLAGILSALFGMSHAIHYLLQAFPFFMKSLFFVLILAGLLQVLKKMTWNRKTFSWLLLSASFSFYFFLQFKNINWTGEVPIPYLCLSGFLAIGAMLLPGISGSSILWLMGSYARVLEILKNFEWSLLWIFAASVGLGFLVFSRCIKWLLEKYPSTSLSVLVGFIVGSLQVLWPWS